MTAAPGPIDPAAAAAEAVRAAGLPGPVTEVTRAGGGYSERIWRVRTAGGAGFALRRHRTGTAAAIEQGVAARLPDLVPPVLHRAGPVTLVPWQPGDPLDAVLPGADLATAREIGHAVGLALARIGRVRFEVGGFFTGADLSPAPMPEASVQRGLCDWVQQQIGHPVPGLSERVRTSYVGLVERQAGALAALPDRPALVHADFNPKNLLGRRVEGNWTIRVLDWEFAFSGSPLVDVGNMLRFAEDHPPGFVEAFVAGFRDGGGDLPPQWGQLARLLDVFALAEFLAADPPRALTPRAASVAAACVERGRI